MSKAGNTGNQNKMNEHDQSHKLLINLQNVINDALKFLRYLLYNETGFLQFIEIWEINNYSLFRKVFSEMNNYL